ncbi:unnamed protein product [Adineta ricciae]|uniref:Exonuclease domain-containing protein n=1 Tax=Adineta ricciae TaxID=249248 RepID=A0A814CL87_ADIRI|nr:unnamed protein product [Adineta ricciae]CAF0941688.1 unnamed protein product [Adineta ricciae]
MASSPIDIQNENVAVLPKKNLKSTKDHTYDRDWINQTNARPFLPSDRHILKKPITDHSCQKRLSKYNGIVNRMTPVQVDEELQKRQLSTNGEIEIRRLRLKHFYKAQITLGFESPMKMIEQHFEYIAVVDFEATCERNQGNNFPHEIIEFPIVLIDVRQQAIVDKFRSYCRPTIKPILSDFCTELTGIQQHQVDTAPTFPEVLRNVENWLNERHLLSSNKRRCGFATDGPWDFAKFLRLQCGFSSLTYPRWAKKWINVRKEFSNFYSVQRCGISRMLQSLGLVFDGRHHSGLDDSVNIARITIELIKDGCVILLNDGVRAADPKFIDLNSISDELQNVNDDDDDDNEAIVDND